MRSWMVEKHSKVPHMRSIPAMKQVTTSSGTLRQYIVTRLQATSPALVTCRMKRDVSRNFSRKRRGKAMEMPRKEDSPAMSRSSCIRAVSPSMSGRADR